MGVQGPGIELIFGGLRSFGWPATWPARTLPRTAGAKSCFAVPSEGAPQRLGTRDTHHMAFRDFVAATSYKADATSTSGSQPDGIAQGAASHAPLRTHMTDDANGETRPVEGRRGWKA